MTRRISKSGWRIGSNWPAVVLFVFTILKLLSLFRR